MNKKLERILQPLIFCGPYLLLFALFVLLPFLMSIGISFLNWDYFGEAKFVGLANYQALFAFGKENFSLTWGGRFWTYLGQTLLFVVIETPLLIVMPLILSGFLNKKIKGGMLSRAIIYFPCILSIATVAIIWVFILDTNTGILNKVLGLSTPWLTKQPYAWVSIFLLSTWWGLGGNTTLFLAGLQGVSKELYEACECDGGGSFTKFIHVTIPGLAPTFAYVAVMTIISTFNVFGQPLMLTNGGPEDSTTVAVQYIYNVAFGGYKFGRACAMSAILAVVMLVFSIAAYLLVKKKEVRADE